MSQAEWMPSPLGERDALERRRRLVRHDSLALTLGAAGIVVGTALLIWAFAALFSNGAVVFLLSLALVVGDFVLARRIDARRDALVREIEAIDEALRDEFGRGTGWFVDLIVLRGAAPVGSDRGVMWIEGDRLYYSGHRTSFALSPADVAGPLRSESPIRGLRNAVTLPLRADGASISLGSASGPFLRDLVSWSRRPAQEPGQLPPTRPGPGLASRSRVLARALASNMYWLSVAYLLLRLGPSTPAFVLAGAAAVVGWMLDLWFPVARWRAWRDLGRLPAPQEGS